jgi:hypothetical protein
MGLSKSDRRLLVMLQGKIDATLANIEHIGRFETKGSKVNVLADLQEQGVHTSSADISATIRFLKTRREFAKAFRQSF